MENIEIIQTHKFKNNAISIVVPVDMDEQVTGYNVLAEVLKRGTGEFKTSSEISRYLQDMYGAIFDIGLKKIGDKLFIMFYVTFLDHRFTLNGENLFAKAVHLLNEVMLNPLFIHEDFDDEIIAQEIMNHRLYIESVYDDKGHYSMERVLEIGLLDSYKIPDHGTLEELDKITKDSLITLWKDLNQKHAFCYVSGNLENEEEVKAEISKLDILKNPMKDESKSSRGKRIFNRDNKENYEKMKINQGKMSLLYNTNISIFDGDYFALVVFNSIFGGGAHSKLFNEVREKHSLAYSIYSTFDKFAGVMTVGGGIDFKNFTKTKQLIDEELLKMIEGHISDEEMTMAKTKVISSLKAMEDSMYNTSNYLIALRVFGIPYTVESVILGIETVTKERIMEVAQGIEFIAAHYLDGEV